MVLVSALILTSALTIQANAQTKNTQSKLEIMSIKIPDCLNDFAIKNFHNQIESINDEADHYCFNKNQMSSFYLGEAFNTYNYKNSDIDVGDVFYYPIMYKDKIKGIYAVTKTKDGKYCATLEKGFAEQLEELKEKQQNKKFRILVTENGLYAINLNTASLLSKNSTQQEIDLVRFRATGYQGHSMTCRGYVEYDNGSKYFSLIDPNKSSYVSFTAYDNTNNVTYILNGDTFYWNYSLQGF